MEKFDFIESQEVPLKQNVYNFSVGYSAINKLNILKSREYLMAKNNMKYVWIC